MRVEEIPLNEVEALLGEKDLIIYMLSKKIENYSTFVIPSLVNKLKERGVEVELEEGRIGFSKVKKNG